MPFFTKVFIERGVSPSLQFKWVNSLIWPFTAMQQISRYMYTASTSI